MQFNSSNWTFHWYRLHPLPTFQHHPGPFFLSETSPSSNTTLSSYLRIWRSMDPSGLGCSTAVSEKINRHLHRHLIYGNFWTSKNMRYLYQWNIWKFMNIWFSIDAVSYFLKISSIFSSFLYFCKLLGVSWIPWIPWRHFSFTWRWRSTCGPSWVAIESPPGPFFEVLTALGGGSEQSIICSKSILINVFVVCFKIRNFIISPKFGSF